MHELEFIAPMIATLAMFVALVTVVRAIVNGRRTKEALEHKSALQQEILKQFTGGEQLNDFLNTPAGQDFVAAAQLPVERSSPYTSILRSVRGGIIATALGVTLYFFNYDIGGEGLYFLGILMTVAGLAVLLAAWVSYYLSQRWGLLRPDDEGENG